MRNVNFAALSAAQQLYFTQLVLGVITHAPKAHLEEALAVCQDFQVPLNVDLKGFFSSLNGLPTARPGVSNFWKLAQAMKQNALLEDKYMQQCFGQSKNAGLTH